MTDDAARRVLVVTDLGPAGEVALAEGVRLTRGGDAVLAVVHAIPSLAALRPVFAHLVAGDALDEALLPDRVRRLLETRLLEAIGDGPPPEVFLETGGTADAALDVARRWAADLIVVGAPDAGAIDAERVVRHAAVPVLVGRRTPTDGPVIACTDFSDPALPAIHAAASEARRAGAPLVVAHVLEAIPYTVLGVEGIGFIPPSAWLESRRAEAEARLAAVLADTGVDGTYVALEGAVVQSLVDLATERAARMLVVGTVGRSGLSRFLLGSIAESVLRSAPCSVLVVRLHRRGGDAPSS